MRLKARERKAAHRAAHTMGKALDAVARGIDCLRVEALGRVAKASSESPSDPPIKRLPVD